MLARSEREYDWYFRACLTPVSSPTGEATAVVSTHGRFFEPFAVPGDASTFTGHATADGVTTRYDDAPLDVVLPGEDFLEYVCRAATGG